MYYCATIGNDCALGAVNNALRYGVVSRSNTMKFARMYAKKHPRRYGGWFSVAADKLADDCMLPLDLVMKVAIDRFRQMPYELHYKSINWARNEFRKWFEEQKKKKQGVFLIVQMWTNNERAFEQMRQLKTGSTTTPKVTGRNGTHLVVLDFEADTFTCSQNKRAVQLRRTQHDIRLMLDQSAQHNNISIKPMEVWEQVIKPKVNFRCWDVE